MANICQNPGCGQEASLQCPTCLNLGIKGSFFCSQPCFKKFWKEHKQLHLLVENGSAKKGNGSENGQWPGYKFSGDIRPHQLTPKRKVPLLTDRPDYADHPAGRAFTEEAIRGSTSIKVLDEEEMEAMRVVGKLTRECFDEAAKAVAVGVTTDELDRLVHEAAIDRDCYPAPLNYNNFPKSCYTAVNEVICHGTPDTRPLQNGDICSMDVTIFHHGFNAELTETFMIGNVLEKHQNLVKAAYEALSNSIEIVKPGVKYSEIGNIIQKNVAPFGFSVVKSYCGHGIHRVFHTAPNVPNFARNNAVGVMKEGHSFTIKPMISEGVSQSAQWPDDWTVVTADGLFSAQFEQTILVTHDGYEILTQRVENNGLPWFMDEQ